MKEYEDQLVADKLFETFTRLKLAKSTYKSMISIQMSKMISSTMVGQKVADLSPGSVLNTFLEAAADLDPFVQSVIIKALEGNKDEKK